MVDGIRLADGDFRGGCDEVAGVLWLAWTTRELFAATVVGTDCAAGALMAGLASARNVRKSGPDRSCCWLPHACSVV